MLNKLLVGIDESASSEWVFETALELAKGIGAELVLVHALNILASDSPENPIKLVDNYLDALDPNALAVLILWCGQARSDLHPSTQKRIRQSRTTHAWAIPPRSLSSPSPVMRIQGIKDSPAFLKNRLGHSFISYETIDQSAF
jgi:hypothetical protein